MKKIGTILITIIEAYFVGAVTFWGTSVLIYVMTGLGNWVSSLPTWGIMIFFVIIGLVAIELYKKLPKERYGRILGEVEEELKFRQEKINKSKLLSEVDKINLGIATLDNIVKLSKRILNEKEKQELQER